ncbi:TPA: 30S ribosomal protein S27ae [Candidatus Bathyarchaeota archaeon]|nr:30S ribosomal protein S27ae [Candidatus Bathyarchaeota archaeon]HIJ08521.1 30S ribosomal protein S27ae [Candidatus Bathyarchaeota archaeon]
MSKQPTKKEGSPAEQKTEEKKEVKPQKVEKAKKEKTKRQEKGAHALYKIEGSKVARLRPTCERCGIGYFMADHSDRYTCGHCGFTRYKRAEK